MAARRAGYAARCIGADAARQTGRADDLPAAVVLSHLDHRNAMRRLRLRHLFGAPVVHAAAVKQAVIGVFVVDAKQAVGRRRLAVFDEGEEMHAVVVHAGLLHLGGRIVAGIGAGTRAVGNRVAPGVEQGRRVALGQDDGIGGGWWNSREVVEHPGGAAGTGGQAWQRNAGGSQGAAANGQHAGRQKAPPERVGQHIECHVMVAFAGTRVKTGVGHGEYRSVSFRNYRCRMFQEDDRG